MWIRSTTKARSRIERDYSQSLLEDFVDSDDRQRAGAARIVDARHRVDGLADLGGGEAVARRDHARRAHPGVGLGIENLMDAEHAAEVLDPAFAAHHMDFA